MRTSNNCLQFKSREKKRRGSYGYTSDRCAWHGGLLGITVKGAKPEFALLVTVGAGLCILAGTVGKMQYLLGMLTQMKSYLPVDSSYLNTLLKMLGITYVGQFSAGICKDAGYSSIAGQIELFARLAVLAVSMPVLLALLETVHDFL